MEDVQRIAKSNCLNHKMRLIYLLHKQHHRIELDFNDISKDAGFHFNMLEASRRHKPIIILLLYVLKKSGKYINDL